MLDRLVHKPLKSFQEKQVSTLLKTHRQKLLDMLNGPYFSDQIKPFFIKVNAEGLPFEDFAAEPKQVIQIKHVFNALYHAEQASLDVEKVDFNIHTKKELAQTFYYNTISHTYQACYLFTHLDVDLNEIFINEIRLLLPFLSKLQESALTYANDAAVLSNKLKQYPFGYTAGWVSGIAVDQMKPDGGKVDYKFLSQFIALLPGYIQQFTAILHEYSPKQLSNFQPLVNQDRLAALQIQGSKFLNSLQNLQSEEMLFASLGSYFDIIEGIVSISMSTLEQIMNLNDSSQDIIRENLGVLKYYLLAQLLSISDRLECETSLAPSTLSTILMDSLKPLYQFLIEHSSKVVKFDIKGRELLTIEDDQFLLSRLEETEQRIYKLKRNLIKIEQTIKCFESFFNVLEQEGKKGSYLNYLPASIKSNLADHYKLLEPYLKKIDLNINNNLINALVIDKSWLGLLNPVNKLPWFKISKILELKTKISDSVQSDKSTQVFHINLNEDLIQSVYARAELSIYPYKQKTNIFDCNEASVLKIDASSQKFNCNIEGNNCYIGRINHLNTDQAFELYQFYSEKSSRLLRAQASYEQFMTIIHANKPKVLEDFDKESKSLLRKLYCRFQPYLVDSLTSNLTMKVYDELIIAHFSERPENADAPKLQKLSTRFFERTEAIFRNKLQECTTRFQKRTETYYNLAAKKYRKDSQDRILQPDNLTANRKSYLLQHTNYSKNIGELRRSLFQLTPLFNKAAQKQLTPAESGPPFPEAEENTDVLAQTRQLVGIKQIFNSLYHLERVVNQLECLNNNSSQTIFVYHLVEANRHLDRIVEAAKLLYKDPHLSILLPELIKNATNLSATLMKQSEPYLINPETITSPQVSKPRLGVEAVSDQVKYTGIWYPLNAFMLLPEQISKQKTETKLSDQEREVIHANTKTVVLKIEKIIASANSYFKLFLKVPALYDLYLELKIKLGQFTTVSHGAVIAHLNEINNDIFKKILLETDEFEDNIGLLPGQFSGPMKLLLDEFYKGLVEPLGIVSYKNIALISKQETIEQRIIAVKKREAKAQEELQQNQDPFAVMSKLMKSIDVYEKFVDDFSAKEHLVDCFKNAVFLLDKNKELFKGLSGFIEKSPEVDLALNNTENVIAHCKIVYNYYKGLIASNEFEIQTAQEKERYLLALRKQQPSFNEQFIVNCINQSIAREIKAVCDRDIGLLHMQQEYNVKFKQFFEKWQKTIINLAKNTDNINALVRKLISERIGRFDQDCYLKYAQLDSVISSLNEFKEYIRKSEIELADEGSTFENAETLAAKKLLVKRLKKKAMNKELTVDDRLQQLREIAENQKFSDIMLRCSEPSLFTLEGLARLVASFLQLINLYTPKYEEHHISLCQAIKAPPKITRFNRYQLFETPKAARYSLPQLTLLETDVNLPDLEMDESQSIELKI
ncbi:MAG: hypothetical protein H0U73_13850 [Tatlockia sp.]|nr:hypothetical protein [Tatlockia sp.]